MHEARQFMRTAYEAKQCVLCRTLHEGRQCFRRDDVRGKTVYEGRQGKTVCGANGARGEKGYERVLRVVFVFRSAFADSTAREESQRERRGEIRLWMFVGDRNKEIFACDKDTSYV